MSTQIIIKINKNLTKHLTNSKREYSVLYMHIWEFIWEETLLNAYGWLLSTWKNPHHSDIKKEVQIRSIIRCAYKSIKIAETIQVDYT